MKRTGSVPFPSNSALVQRVVASRISVSTDFQASPCRARIKRIPKTGASHPDANSTATGRCTSAGRGSSRMSSSASLSHPWILVEKLWFPPNFRVNPMGKWSGQLSVFEILSLRSSIFAMASADREPRDRTFARNHSESGERPRQSVKVPPVSTKKDHDSFLVAFFIWKKQAVARRPRLPEVGDRTQVNLYHWLPGPQFPDRMKRGPHIHSHWKGIPRPATALRFGS